MKTAPAPVCAEPARLPRDALRTAPAVSPGGWAAPGPSCAPARPWAPQACPRPRAPQACRPSVQDYSGEVGGRGALPKVGLNRGSPTVSLFLAGWVEVTKGTIIMQPILSRKTHLHQCVIKPQRIHPLIWVGRDEFLAFLGSLCQWRAAAGWGGDRHMGSRSGRKGDAGSRASRAWAAGSAPSTASPSGSSPGAASWSPRLLLPARPRLSPRALLVTPCCWFRSESACCHQPPSERPSGAPSWPPPALRLCLQHLGGVTSMPTTWLCSFCAPRPPKHGSLPTSSLYPAFIGVTPADPLRLSSCIASSRKPSCTCLPPMLLPSLAPGPYHTETQLESECD